MTMGWVLIIIVFGTFSVSTTNVPGYQSEGYRGKRSCGQNVKSSR